MPYLLALIPLALSIATLADIIMRGEHQVKHLSKTFWIIIVILVPLVGSILWWAIGREYETRPREAMGFGDPRRTSRYEQQAAERALSQTELEIIRLDAEIAQAEADARIRRLEEEVAERRRETGTTKETT